jgi:hypothetical protein
MQTSMAATQITKTSFSARDVVNLSLYPIEDLSGAFAAQVIQMQNEFKRTGVVVLKDFIRPDRMPELIREANEMAPLAYHNELTGNAYLEKTDESLPVDHPKRMTERTALGAVAYDQMPAESLLRQVYEWAPVMQFIAALVERPVYQYACPMGALNISVMKDGDYLRWHFDQSDFVVSINLQDAESGGDFEYVHMIRGPGKENFDEVRRVLNGDRSRVKRLNAGPGAMILFQGRYTIHRVTEIKGERQRLMALLGYVDQPGQTSTEYLRQIRYGRNN